MKGYEIYRGLFRLSLPITDSFQLAISACPVCYAAVFREVVIAAGDSLKFQMMAHCVEPPCCHTAVNKGEKASTNKILDGSFSKSYFLAQI